jgi:hypothetical protein
MADISFTLGVALKDPFLHFSASARIAAVGWLWTKVDSQNRGHRTCCNASSGLYRWVASHCLQTTAVRITGVPWILGFTTRLRLMQATKEKVHKPRHSTNACKCCKCMINHDEMICVCELVAFWCILQPPGVSFRDFQCLRETLSYSELSGPHFPSEVRKTDCSSSRWGGERNLEMKSSRFIWWSMKHHEIIMKSSHDLRWVYHVLSCFIPSWSHFRGRAPLRICHLCPGLPDLAPAVRHKPRVAWGVEEPEPKHALSWQDGSSYA